jgi:uncharacterized peroxidase-related enzyme
MTTLPISGIPVLSEDDATGQVKDVFDEVRRVLEIPFVPNIHKGLAAAPNVLAGTWDALRNVFLGTSLPMPLASMILFSIAAAKKCRYCSAVHHVTCLNVGVEQDTLAALDGDLEGLTPRRVRAIVKFAQKCAQNPQSLEAVDYEAVKAEGVSDQELVEIIGLAALGNYLDTIADAMKIEVDEAFTEILSS